MLTRDAILALPDLPFEAVPVPEWGGSVGVRTMSGTERDRFETEHARAPTANFRARIAAATLCGDDGALLFAPADVEALGAKSSAALDRVVEAAIRVNKFGAKDVEELAKN